MNYLEGELTLFVTDNQIDEYPREIQDNDITRSELTNSSRHEYLYSLRTHAGKISL